MKYHTSCKAFHGLIIPIKPQFWHCLIQKQLKGSFRLLLIYPHASVIFRPFSDIQMHLLLAFLSIIPCFLPVVNLFLKGQSAAYNLKVMPAILPY